MSDTNSASSVPCEKASVAPTEPSLTREQSVAAIRGVVPDLGEGFVKACLDIYRGNVEQVIDAIFADNLHPALKALDRSLQKVWIGKQDREPEFLQKSGYPSAGVLRKPRWGMGGYIYIIYIYNIQYDPELSRLSSFPIAQQYVCDLYQMDAMQEWIAGATEEDKST